MHLKTSPPSHNHTIPYHTHIQHPHPLLHAYTQHAAHITDIHPIYTPNIHPIYTQIAGALAPGRLRTHTLLRNELIRFIRGHYDLLLKETQAKDGACIWVVVVCVHDVWWCVHDALLLCAYTHIMCFPIQPHTQPHTHRVAVGCHAASFLLCSDSQCMWSTAGRITSIIYYF